MTCEVVIKVPEGAVQTNVTVYSTSFIQVPYFYVNCTQLETMRVPPSPVAGRDLNRRHQGKPKPNRPMLTPRPRQSLFHSYPARGFIPSPWLVLQPWGGNHTQCFTAKPLY